MEYGAGWVFVSSLLVALPRGRGHVVVIDAGQEAWAVTLVVVVSGGWGEGGIRDKGVLWYERRIS